METVYIDGSLGEGGGQVLRTSISLSAITGKRLHIENIRASRPRPGLARQHLACVEAACKICNARCSSAELRSKALDFSPGEVQAGDYHFDISSAGSALLVIQTVLPILFCAEGSSSVTVTGGTHNPWAPPFDFVKESFLPAIGVAGFEARCELSRYGFYPAGGGKVIFEIQPWHANDDRYIDLCEPTARPRISATIYTAKLPGHIAQKQRRLLLSSGLSIEDIEHIDVTDSDSAGNCVMIRLRGAKRTSVFTGFGSKGKPSEKVIEEVVCDTRDFLAGGACIDHYLADQLLIYMAMHKGGRFTTNQLTKHLTTNIEVIKKFLSVDFVITKQENNFEICCLSASGSRDTNDELPTTF